MSVKSSSKHTKRQPYWFSTCSGILVWWCLWCTWFEDKWTVGTNRACFHKIPFQVYAVAFPFCSVLLLRCYPNLRVQQLILIIFIRRNSNNDNNKRTYVRSIGAHSCSAPAAQCYCQPAQCQLATVLVPFKMKISPCPPQSLPKPTPCFQPAPSLVPTQYLSLSQTTLYTLPLRSNRALSSLTESPSWQQLLPVRPFSRPSF